MGLLTSYGGGVLDGRGEEHRCLLPPLEVNIYGGREEHALILEAAYGRRLGGYGRRGGCHIATCSNMYGGLYSNRSLITEHGGRRTSLGECLPIGCLPASGVMPGGSGREVPLEMCSS